MGPSKSDRGNWHTVSLDNNSVSGMSKKNIRKLVCDLLTMRLGCGCVAEGRLPL